MQSSFNVPMTTAQTGGVISWTSRPGYSPVPVRVRVVNGKRTDLAEEMRTALNKKLCSSWWGRCGPIDPSIRLLIGHTRFATSSKATMEGTHPHSWCPPQVWRVYLLDNISLWQSKEPHPVSMSVSNFITHNGDFDFFKLNGDHAHLNSIQQWLVEATGFPMPAPVDSAAIAGMVDIIRTAGCFALSIRYAHLLTMPHSRISMAQAFPSSMDYDWLSKFFEATLLDFCKSIQGMTLRQISNDSDLRQTFSERVAERIQASVCLKQTAFCDYAEKQQMDAIMGDAEENMVTGLRGTTILQLVKQSIDAFFDNDLYLTTRLFMKNAVGSFGLVVTSSMDAHRQVCIAARGQPMSIAF